MTEAGERPLRLFIALELPAAVRRALVAWRTRALGDRFALRPLDADALHLTLCFLGWRPAAALEPIGALLSQLASEPAAELALGGARWLPPRRPRVLAVEVVDPQGRLAAIQAALSQSLSAAGWYETERRPYLAHVTVARVGRWVRVPAGPLPAPPPLAFRGARIVLYRSHLARGGARYEPLAAVELRAAAAGDRPCPPLVDARELAERLASPTARPTLLDVRWALATGPDRRAYRRGHIPGAQFVDLDRQLADPPSERGRHPLPSADRFGAEMRALGVSASRPVVVYDAGNATAAARAWWLLRYFGHPCVAVLDGGLAAWVEAGGELATDTPPAQAGDFVARPGSMPVIDAEGAAAIAAAGVLLDARAPERFAGTHEPVDPVAGHIPGARNRPTTDNLDPRGRFLPRAALRQAFARLGVEEGVPVAAYCGSGVTAAHEVLALELAGHRAALYPGSWSEWIADPARPVER